METTNMKDAFLSSVASFLREQYEKTDVAEVVSAVEKTETGGYCETCWYEETVIRVVYVDTSGEQRETTIYENFASLVRWLTETP